MFADQLLDYFGMRHLWQQLRKFSDKAYIGLKGDQDIAGAKVYEQGPYAISVEISTAQINLDNGAVFEKTITEDTTLTFAGAPTAKAATFNLLLTNGGAFAVTWPQSVEWTDDTPPDLTAEGMDVLTFLTPNGGTTWYGTVALSGVSV